MKPKASSINTAVITPPTIFRMFFILVGGFYTCDTRPVCTYRVPVRVPIGILLIVQALAVLYFKIAAFAFPRKRVNALCIFVPLMFFFGVGVDELATKKTGGDGPSSRGGGRPPRQNTPPEVSKFLPREICKAH